MTIPTFPRRLIALTVLILAALALPVSPAAAKSGAMKYRPDYGNVRGFNYNTISSRNYQDQWERYNHEEVARDMGYAQRLRLNTVRVYMAYKAWVADKEKYRRNIRDFVRTAHAHDIGVMVVIVDGPRGMMDNLFEESAKPMLRDYAQDLVRTIGDEPGLSFWDVANEPDWVRLPVSPPNTNQRQRIAVAKFMAQTLNELDADTPVTVGCQFLTCTEEVAPFVDVLSYHDYSQTRAQIQADITRAQALSKRVGKPVITTETACIGRANPYDIAIEEHDKAGQGWIIWELMIAQNWGNVHGVMYADGTIRDPAIIASILGFHRNRSPHVVLEQTDREGITSGILDEARKWLAAENPDYFDGMVIAETIANTLEAGQLVGLRILPTARVERLREGPKNVPALRILIQEFADALAPNAIPGTEPRHRYYTPKVERPPQWR